MPGVFIDIRVKGVEDVVRKLAGLESVIVEAAKTGLYEKGFEMEGAMKEECPHKSGHLRRNIKCEEPEVEA